MSAWLLPQSIPVPRKRYLIAGTYVLGFLSGAALQVIGCGPVPREPSVAAVSVIDCKTLAMAPFLGVNPAHMTLADGRELVRNLRRCIGKDTVFMGEDDDLFGIDLPGGAPAPAAAPYEPPLDPSASPSPATRLDGGIFRSL